MPKLITKPEFTGYSDEYSEVYCGDCRWVMRTLSSLGMKYNLIFADPPFNIGQNYDGYSDRLPSGEYDKFICALVLRAANLLHENGVLCLHGPDELVESYMRHARQAGLVRIAWINWHYRFGQCSRENWIDSRCHCLIYARSLARDHKLFTRNPEAVMVDSDRATKYNDKRVERTGGKRMPFTVWSCENDGPGFGRVQGTSTQRRHAHPNQLPENYIERLLKYYTNPVDKVLDPVSGSGTTVTVAKRLGRHGTAIDISEANCRSIVERLSETSVG